MTAHAAWDPDEARALIDARRDRPGATLLVLNALLDRFGYVDEAAVPLVADALNLSRAEVHGVVTFYHDYRRTPPGRRVVRVCRAEACQARGGTALVEHVRGSLGVDFGETTADGAITLEQVFCLGNCACAPSVMVGRRVHGRVDAAAFDRIVAEVRG